MRTTLREKIVLIAIVWAVFMTFVVPFLYTLVWVYSPWVLIPTAIFITYKVIKKILKNQEY